MLNQALKITQQIGIF